MIAANGSADPRNTAMLTAGPMLKCRRRTWAGLGDYPIPSQLGSGTQQLGGEVRKTGRGERACPSRNHVSVEVIRLV